MLRLRRGCSDVWSRAGSSGNGAVAPDVFRLPEGLTAAVATWRGFVAVRMQRRNAATAGTAVSAAAGSLMTLITTETADNLGAARLRTPGGGGGGGEAHGPRLDRRDGGRGGGGKAVLSAAPAALPTVAEETFSHAASGCGKDGHRAVKKSARAS